MRLFCAQRFEPVHRVAVCLSALLLAAMVAGCTLGSAPAASNRAQPAIDAALAAISEQWVAVASDDERRLAELFAGDELGRQRAQRARIRDSIASGSDYPGEIELSDVRDVVVSGDLETGAVVTLAAHATLANMRGGVVIDHSSSDLLYQLDLRNEDGRWKVSSMRSSFDPAGEHP